MIRWSLAVSFLGSIYTIYLGYVLYSRLVEMLAASAFEPVHETLQAVERAQYYCFLIALTAFCLSVWKGIWNAKK
jgi:hypothetical protein